MTGGGSNVDEKGVLSVDPHALITKNMALAMYIAKKYVPVYEWVPSDDIVGYAREGLVNAAYCFNPQKGEKFSAYAGKSIRNMIRRRVLEYEQSIRLPVNKVIERSRKAREERRRISTEALQEKYLDTGAYYYHVHSLDAPITNKKGEEGNSLMDIIPSCTLGPEHLRDRSKEGMEIAEILKSKLKGNEYYVLVRISGFQERPEDGDKGATFAAVGKELGLGRQRPRVIYETARKKAAKILRNRGFTPETCSL